LPAGESITLSQSLVLPMFLTGQKWLVVKADAGNVFYELNKENNLHVSGEPINIGPTLLLSISPPAFDQSSQNPAATGLLLRSGDTSASLSVSLSNSDPTSISAPAAVTIPAGQSSVSFPVNAVPTSSVGGSRNATLVASADSYQSASSTVTVLNKNVPTLAITIEPSTVGQSYSQPVLCQLARNTPTDSDLTVSLVSDVTKLTVPTSVTIPAGSSSTTFNALVVSNPLPASSANVTVSAVSAGFVTLPGTITITDDALPKLVLTTANQFVTETSANPASQGTVAVSSPVAVPLKIILLSDSPLIVLPPSVQLPAGSSSATFFINVVNDNLVHGPTVATLTAYIADALSGSIIPSTAARASITDIDDNGPALKLSLAAAAIAETGSTTAEVTCNAIPGQDLVVTLASSDPSVATVPATAVIPAGHTSGGFTVTPINPGVPTGPRRTTITASTPTFASAVAVLNVSDVNLPDLRVTQIMLPATALAASMITATYSVENDGIWPAAGGWTDYVYYTTSPNGANLHPVGQFDFTDSLAVGASYTHTVSVLLPPDPGQYFLVVRANPGQSLTELSYDNNSLISTTYTDVQPPYHASVVADLAGGPTGTAIPMHGQAFDAQNPNQPAPFVPVTIRISVKGTRRVFPVTTDGNANFTYRFQPLANEAGIYQVSADHPAVASDTNQSGFTLYGLAFADGGSREASCLVRAFQARSPFRTSGTWRSRVFPRKWRVRRLTWGCRVP